MDQKLIFTTPTINYKETFLSGIGEFQREKLHLEYNVDELEKHFEDYVEERDKESKGIELKQGRVPQTIYWLIADGKYVGRVSIRHFLNDHLVKTGGHIGYDVVPSERKKGYGSMLLKYGLERAREMKLEKVLLTCDENNIGSLRIIEKMGGILENKVPGKATDDPLACRFWINLK